MKHGRYIRAAALAGLLGVLTLTPSVSALAAGWTQQNGGWVYYDNNGNLAKGWSRSSDGYYFLDLQRPDVHRLEAD